MTFEGWVILGLIAVFGLYIVLRLLFVWVVYGGGGKVDYYGNQDSEK